jgi:uncharacterized phage protein (TIGR01671 family)
LKHPSTMSREIKFRVWDGVTMTFPSIIGINMENFSWNQTRSYLHNSQEWSGDDGFISNPKLMQYTGLRDKKGVDIYEGDLYQVAGNKIYEVKYIDKKQVNSGGFETYGACFVLWISEDLFFPFDEYAMEHGKVIGNIYSNPEAVGV